MVSLFRRWQLCGLLVKSNRAKISFRFVAGMDGAIMQKAVVKSLPGEPNLTITLTLAGKLRNLDRPKNEALEKPLLRIQKSAAPQPDKRQRRQKKGFQQEQDGDAGAAAAAEPSVPAVALHAGATEAAPPLDAAATSNAEAWQHGFLLRVGQVYYQVELNPPIVDRLEVPGGAFVGIPLYPLLAAHFADEGACKWRWLRRGSAQGTSAEGWSEISGATQRLYTPCPEDAGCTLRVECTPARRCTPLESEPADTVYPLLNGGSSNSDGSNSGSQPGNQPEPRGSSSDQAAAGLTLVRGETAFTECGPVSTPPCPLGAQPRLELTQERAQAPEFRVVTYNILADQYAATETAKNVLFAHCPPECLAPDYRRPLVLAELLGLKGDVVCLQEVDDKMFSQLLQPQLGVAGYQGVYTNKAGKVREGSALFFRTDRFALVAQRDLALKDFFPPSPATPLRYGHVFGPMLRSSPQLLHALQRIATVAQLALLAPVNDPEAACRPLLVANTHLFFHYMAPHIRTMHTWVIMQEAQWFIEEALADPALSAQLGGRAPSLLFCGDLNSDLNDGIPGAVELLGRGQLSADFWDWMFGVGFKWGMGGEEGAVAAAPGDEEDEGSSNEYGEVSKMVHGSVEHAHPSASPEQPVVPGVELAIPFRLASADRLRSLFTNYVRGYQGLLDYIWYSPGEVEVVREVPLPSPAELGGYLPSPRFPSDHLPVVFDLRFISQQQAKQGSAQQQQQEQEQQWHGDHSEATGEAGAADGVGNVLPAALYNVGVAVDELQAGHVIALPTDTLYGLASCASNRQGVAAIYQAKGRARGKPLAISVADPAEVSRYAHTEHLPRGLLDALLPGPLTLLLKRKEATPLAPQLNPGLDVIGIRVPDSPFVRAVSRQHRGALVLTSANVSQGVSTTKVSEFQELWPACGAVFDGGTLQAGRAGSTVLDLTAPGRFRVPRRGAGFADAVTLLTQKFGLVHELA